MCEEGRREESEGGRERGHVRRVRMKEGTRRRRRKESRKVSKLGMSGGGGKRRREQEDKGQEETSKGLCGG